MTVVMKIDLVGPERRGLALGLNESAGYGGVAARRRAQRLAGRRVRRPRRARRRRRGRRRRSRSWSRSLFVRDTAAHVALEQAAHDHARRQAARRSRERLRRRDLPRAGAALVLAGRPGQQPQRRPGLGPRAALPRRPRRQRRRDRARRRPLPGRLGRRPDLDRPLVRPRRAQAADRRRACCCRPPRLRVLAARDGARRRRRGRRGRCSASAPRSSTRR